MRYIFLFTFFLFSTISFSCECPELVPISKEECKKYDVVFYGKVDSVNACGTNGISTVFFTINELYKGAVQANMKLDFDCASECMMSFEKGEEWLIYATYQHFDLLTATFCEHSRKKNAEGTQDFYFPAAKRTFEQEKQFLISTFGTIPFSEKNDINSQQALQKPHNEQPSGINKLLLLGVSLLTMLVVFYFSRKKKG